MNPHGAAEKIQIFKKEVTEYEKDEACPGGAERTLHSACRNCLRRRRKLRRQNQGNRRYHDRRRTDRRNSGQSQRIPECNQDRSVALTLFEDVYGGKIKWITTTSDTKFDDLANHINSGDQIDMFPYEWDAVPNGVTKGMYDPLDSYVDLSSPIWNDMRDYAETYRFDSH